MELEMVGTFLLVAVVLLGAGFFAGERYGKRTSDAAKNKLDVARNALHVASFRLSTYVSGEAVKIKGEIDAELRKLI